MKNKKIKFLVLFLLLAIVGAGAAFGTDIIKKIQEASSFVQEDSDNNGQEKEDVIDTNDGVLSFVVLGDVHGDIGAFQDAIDDFYDINKKTDALILNGDSVDEGKDEQYEKVNNVLVKKKKKLPSAVIKNIGNHEFYNYDEKTDTVEHTKEFTNKHLKFSGTEKVYNDTWIEDYHFISLGSDNVQDNNTDSASLTKEQLSWLNEKLKEKYVKGKPIFVFLHQPISVTFFGNPWNGVKQGNELTKILAAYPEVILFSSHTHKEFGSDYYQDDLNVKRFHTGAVSYTIAKDVNGKENGYSRLPELNNGLYVEVQDNKVVVKGRDIVNHKWAFSKDVVINNN